MTKVLNQLVYQKGGWVLHMLRGVIGTDDFWTGIREYYRRYRNGNATTNDLRRVMEEASGEDLAGFFDQWLTRAQSPSFEGGWRYNAAAKQVEIEINQSQAGDAYRMPIEIGIATDGQAATTRVERFDMRSKHNVFTVPADREPEAVTFDPNTWLLLDQVSFAKRP
jgi:aminopeptidase N